jgi:hypothetical protein
MFRVLFLILFAMSSCAFAQTQEKKEAYKFFEYEQIGRKLLEEKIQSFCTEIDKTGWVGQIINYGTPNEIEKREDQLKAGFSAVFPQSCHDTRIIFIRGGEEEKSKTRFWIVPPGENAPGL